jgi:hypothetical protein
MEEHTDENRSKLNFVKKISYSTNFSLRIQRNSLHTYDSTGCFTEDHKNSVTPGIHEENETLRDFDVLASVILDKLLLVQYHFYIDSGLSIFFIGSEPAFLKINAIPVKERRSLQSCGM